MWRLSTPAVVLKAIPQPLSVCEQIRSVATQQRQAQVRYHEMV